MRKTKSTNTKTQKALVHCLEGNKHRMLTRERKELGVYTYHRKCMLDYYIVRWCSLWLKISEISQQNWTSNDITHMNRTHSSSKKSLPGKQEAEKGAAVMVADDQAKQQSQDPDFSAEITIVHVVRILLAVAVSWQNFNHIKRTKTRKTTNQADVWHVTGEKRQQITKFFWVFWRYITEV